MRIAGNLALLATLTFGSQAYAGILGEPHFTREDVLECSLSDGSKFILKSKYVWTPIPLTRHSSEHGRNEEFRVYYHKRLRLQSIKLNATYPSERLQTTSQMEQICKGLGGLKNTAFGDNFIIRLTDNKVFEFESNSDRSVSLTENGDTKILKEMRDLYNAQPTSESALAVLIIGSNLFVSEDPLVDKNNIVVAVYRTESNDYGVTWKKPRVSRNAEIFRIGKALKDQFVFARPLKFNGKKIEDMRREEARLVAQELEEVRTEEANRQKRAEAYAQTLEGAIVQGNRARFDQLLNASVDINALGHSPYRTNDLAPLLVALDKPEYAPYALALIQRGANLTPKGIYEGVTVLMLAAGGSTSEVMQALLAKQKFDINQRNPNGETALSYAVAAGMAANVKFLLERGADVSEKSGEGSLIEIARQQGYTEIVKLLERRKR